MAIPVLVGVGAAGLALFLSGCKKKSEPPKEIPEKAVKSNSGPRKIIPDKISNKELLDKETIKELKRIFNSVTYEKSLIKDEDIQNAIKIATLNPNEPFYGFAIRLGKHSYGLIGFVAGQEVYDTNCEIAHNNHFILSIKGEKIAMYKELMGCITLCSFDGKTLYEYSLIGMKELSPNVPEAVKKLFQVLAKKNFKIKNGIEIGQDIYVRVYAKPKMGEGDFVGFVMDPDRNSPLVGWAKVSVIKKYLDPKIPKSYQKLR